MAARRHEMVWCDPGWLPVNYGFCPSPKAWRKLMKEKGLKHEPYPTSDARATTFTSKNGAVWVVVTMQESHDDRSLVSIVCLIAHEAVHVWQKIRDAIGEAHPSPEFEAYSVQAILHELLAAYTQTRRPIGSF